jgi:hypothetical protein
MVNTEASDSGKTTYLYEKPVPFTKSKIWQLNRDYYQSNGTKAWSEGLVPQHITSNARVGKNYAEIIYAFLKDLALKGHIEETAYILELGAGHGRLAYYIMKALDKLTNCNAGRLPPYRYVISDIGSENLTFFKEHEKFQEYFERGVLDVAYFDAEQSHEIDLHFAKQTIKEGDLSQPILTIGNYFFDSIPNDLFYIKDGSVSPCYVGLESNQDFTNLESNDLLPNLNLKFSLANPVQSYYSNLDIEVILNDYRSQLSNTFLLFPKTGIDCINRIRNLSSQGLLFISLDKGNCEIENLDNVPVPDMVNHGSMSFLVNYHCLFQHCRSNGGNVLYPELSGFRLQMVFLMYLENCKSYTETQLSFDRYVSDFGPDDLNSIKNFMYDNIANCSIKDIMVVLKLFDYDHLIFQRMLPRLKQLIIKIGLEEREIISKVMEKVWDTHFSLGRYFDLGFEIGGIFYQLGYYSKALVFFGHSELLFGYTADVFYNRMMCYYQLRQDDLLRSTLEHAKNMFPDYENFSSIESLDMESK